MKWNEMDIYLTKVHDLRESVVTYYGYTTVEKLITDYNAPKSSLGPFWVLH